MFRYLVSYLLVLQLLSYVHSTIRGEEEEHGQNGKIFFVIILRHTQLSFDMVLWCKIVKLKVRSNLLNVWGEYKYHSNFYIQGTTILWE